MKEQQQLPQAVELEEAIIGTLLNESGSYNEIADIISETSFYEYKHEVIFKAIKELHQTNSAVDILTVSNKLETENMLEKAGGRFGIVNLSSKVSSSAHITYHAKIVQQKAKARAFIFKMSELVKGAYVGDIQEIIEESERSLYEIGEVGIKKDFKHVKDILPDVYDEITKSASNTGDVTGIPSGFTDLDKLTSGWQSQDLIIIAGRPAMGKTAFSLSMMYNISRVHKIPSALFSLEMGDSQLVKRLLSTTSSVEGHKIKTGRLDAEEWKRIDAGVGRLLEAPIYIDDTPGLSIYDLRSKARKLVKDHGVKIIMVDYLQLMKADKRNRQEEIALISRSLKTLAKELNIPIVALSQLNRGVEDRDGIDGKRPQLSDLRESGAIEQDADIVGFLYRPEYYGFTQDENGQSLKGIVEIVIGKHRNGTTDDVRLRFRGEFTRFENLDDYADSLSNIQPPIEVNNINNNIPF